MQNFEPKKNNPAFLEFMNDLMAAAAEVEKFAQEADAKKEEQKKSSYEALAKDVKEMYDAFILAGFSVDQAFMLTETLVRNFTAKN